MRLEYIINIELNNTIMEQTNHYIAKEGYTYKRKIDGFIMGNELYLGKFIDGTQDTIDNYEEVIDENPQPEKPVNRLRRNNISITK